MTEKIITRRSLVRLVSMLYEEIITEQTVGSRDIPFKSELPDDILLKLTLMPPARMIHLLKHKVPAKGMTFPMFVVLLTALFNTKGSATKVDFKSCLQEPRRSDDLHYWY